MTNIIAARSEAQFDQVRLLWKDYRLEVEAMASAEGSCG